MSYTRVEIAQKACDLFHAIGELLELDDDALAAIKRGDSDVSKIYGDNIKLFNDPAAPIFETLGRKIFDLTRASIGQL